MSLSQPTTNFIISCLAPLFLSVATPQLLFIIVDIIYQIANSYSKFTLGWRERLNGKSYMVKFSSTIVYLYW